MSLFVYALCALTSFVCCVLLLRQHYRRPQRLLFHSAVAFFCFALANILLFVDVIVVPQADLRLWRNLINLFGVIFFLVVLIVGDGKERQ
jgi:hypothetical protein